MNSILKICLPMITLSLLLSSCAHALIWDGKIIEVKNNQSLSLPELAQKISNSDQVILGEKHNTPSIQLAQASVMEAVLDQSPQKDFTTAWEFLNYTTQEQTKDAFEQFTSGKISVADFLTMTQGNSKYMSYAPIIELTKKRGGKILGVNLPRKDKDPVVAGGIQSANPGTIPPAFEMGGKNYFERFTAAMEGHATPEQIQNYFAAQCLTDDVMAFHLLKDSNSPLKFLVVGSFHSEYDDGTVARLLKRAPELKIANLRFIDASDYSESELKSIATDPKYGDLADYIYFVNEPNP